MKVEDAIAQDQLGRAQKQKAPLQTGIAPAKKNAIAVLTPTLGMISMWWHSAMVDLIWPMNTGKVFIPAVDTVGGCIGEVRNRLVSMVLMFEEAHKDTDVSHIMWIDDDVIVNRACMQSLLAHDRDIASGVYFCKGDFGEPLIFPSASGGTIKHKPWGGDPLDPNRAIEAYGWAQGLCMIKTDVYKRMKTELELPLDKFGNPSWYKQPEFGIDENSGQVITGGTEDFHFFENCSKLGYRPVVDFSKFSFGWHYHAAEKLSYPKIQWEQFLRREPIVWPAKGDQPEVIWS